MQASGVGRSRAPERRPHRFSKASRARLSFVARPGLRRTACEAGPGGYPGGAEKTFALTQARSFLARGPGGCSSDFESGAKGAASKLGCPSPLPDTSQALRKTRGDSPVPSPVPRPQRPPRTWHDLQVPAPAVRLGVRGLGPDSQLGGQAARATCPEPLRRRGNHAEVKPPGSQAEVKLPGEPGS